MGPVLSTLNRVSGNFGELRSSHFHAGIDYKTDGTEGLPVFAAADGYVSRVKTSAVGYGKAIYITHPNAVVTVYGHLRSYLPALEDTIRKLQDSLEEYEQEIFPDSTMFIFRKGDIIGYSGNTGSSEGPHLHFETRHKDSEKPFNPELAGYIISDTIPPVIKAVAIYQPGFSNRLSGSSRSIIENDSLCNKDTLILPQKFFIGFEAFDKADNDENLIGIRSFTLFLDDSLILSVSIDSFAFEETRMINALIDYSYSKAEGRKFILCHALKGNTLSFLKNTNGIISLRDTSLYRLKLKVDDTSGNSAELIYFIRKGKTAYKTIKHKKEKLVEYGKELKINAGDYKIEFSPYSLYEDTWISSILKHEKQPDLISPVLIINPEAIAIHRAIDVSLKATQISPEKEPNIIAVQINAKGKKSGISTTTSNGWTTFKTRNTGMYSLQLDTVAPEASQPEWECDDFTGFQRLIIPVPDDISGIRKVKCYINESWLPAPYSYLQNRITIFPEDLPANQEKLTLRIELTDNAANTSNTEYQVKYKR